MSIYLKKNIAKDGMVGLLKVEEDVSFYKRKLVISEAEKNEIRDLKPRKKLEWFASRYLLHIMSGRTFRGECLKDPLGKPYLKGSESHISMSHSKDMVAVMSSLKPSGIDIQVIQPKIERIARKFINIEEWRWIENEFYVLNLHAVWGAKESLFKAYGKGEVDFRKNLLIYPFIFDENGFEFKGKFEKDEVLMNFRLYCKKIDDYILVYAIEE